MAIAIILLLLCSPVELPAPRKASPECWQALKAVAERLEITGPHERWIDDFRSEVHYVRHHLRESRDAPLLEDCDLLPPRPLALGFHAFYLRRQLHLEQLRCIMLHHQEQIDALLSEAHRDVEVWALIDCATNPCQSWPARRKALQRLREALGPGYSLFGLVEPGI